MVYMLGHRAQHVNWPPTSGGLPMPFDSPCSGRFAGRNGGNMGIEIRRVPADWQHPKEDGDYIPLLDGNELNDALEHWDHCNTLWSQGKRHDTSGLGLPAGWNYYFWERAAPVIDIEPENRRFNYAEWAGPRPEPKDYTDFGGRPCTHFQAYENISEGTPRGPVCATEREALESVGIVQAISVDELVEELKNGPIDRTAIDALIHRIKERGLKK